MQNWVVRTSRVTLPTLFFMNCFPSNIMLDCFMHLFTRYKSFLEMRSIMLLAFGIGNGEHGRAKQLCKYCGDGGNCMHGKATYYCKGCLCAGVQPARRCLVLFRPPSAACAPPLRRRSSVRMKKKNTGAELSNQGHRAKAMRQREQVEEEDAPALIQVAAHGEPLVVLALVKSNFGTLVCAQACNLQGVVLFFFDRLQPRVPRSFAGAPVYELSLTHAERLCAVGCGLKGKLVRMLSLGVGRYFEPQRNTRACHQMMQIIVRRVSSKLMAAVRDKAAKKAEELCASGQFAAAEDPLQRAIHLGDFSSLALKAWLHIHGRKGVAKDHEKAFELAEQGARWGCHHCQGVLACCFFGNWVGGYGCKQDEARSLELARQSSGRGSRYGQFTLGKLSLGKGRLARDYAQALAFYRLTLNQAFFTTK